MDQELVSRSGRQPDSAGTGLRKFGIVLLLTVLAAVLALSKMLGGPYALRLRHEFDAARWQAAKDDLDGDRYLMVKDLLARHSPLGFGSDEVHTLLGQPDSQWEHGQTLVDTAITERYYLGPEPGLMSIDSIWLFLTYSGGVVTEAHLATD